MSIASFSAAHGKLSSLCKPLAAPSLSVMLREAGLAIFAHPQQRSARLAEACKQQVRVLVAFTDGFSFDGVGCDDLILRWRATLRDRNPDAT